MEDTIIGMLITAGIIILFIILGSVFLKGKGTPFIARYNTGSKEEKENYDTVALTKFIGRIMFALSFCMLLWLFSMAYAMNWLFNIGLILFIGIVVFMIVYVNTGERFKVENRLN